MVITNFKTLLAQFLSFKSVSADPKFKLEMFRAAEWLRVLFEENGFVTELWEAEEANPVVFASYDPPKADFRNDTVLVYGHYDVQPAEEEDGWNGDPFKLREENGKLIARGVMDNKGQVLIHMWTVFKLIKEKKLKYNVKFLIEGDEETGSTQLGELVRTNREKIKSDAILISDGLVSGPFPVTELSLRGTFNATVTYKTANTNLHSGQYGGAVPNAANELAKFVANLHDSKNRVAIPDFYDDVDPITTSQKQNNRTLDDISLETFKATGIKKFLTVGGVDVHTQTGLLPTVQVTGFKSGYISEGYSNIVPAVAEVRLNFRLVTSQEPKKMVEQFRKYVAAVAPGYLDFEISITGLDKPVRIENSKRLLEVEKLLEEVYGRKVLHKYIGGSIGVVSDFVELGCDMLLIPLANEDSNMHGASENFDLKTLEKGLEFSEKFFSGQAVVARSRQ